MRRRIQRAITVAFCALVASCTVAEEQTAERASALVDDARPITPPPPVLSGDEAQPAPPPPPEEEELSFALPYRRATQLSGARLARGDRQTWQRLAPEIEVITIESTSDGAAQRALFYDSGTDRAKPLLVALHSWSATFLQNVNIPFARFAVENDWVFVQPHFRGKNRHPDATGSELAVQDVLDAVEHARAVANVDDSRIYLMGYSGGAMMGLLLAGRYPERWAGVATWVAVVDLVDWYDTERRTGRRYAREIAASCGGPPRPGSAAEAECRRRSPITWLARAEPQPRVFIAHGIGDRLASPEHALRAFNAIAAPEDRIAEEHINEIVSHRRAPAALAGDGDLSFRAAGAPALIDRSSGSARLVLFDGGHDMLYEPGLRWLSEQRRG